MKPDEINKFLDDQDKFEKKTPNPSSITEYVCRDCGGKSINIPIQVIVFPQDTVFKIKQLMDVADDHNKKLKDDEKDKTWEIKKDDISTFTLIESGYSPVKTPESNSRFIRCPYCGHTRTFKITDN